MKLNVKTNKQLTEYVENLEERIYELENRLEEVVDTCNTNANYNNDNFGAVAETFEEVGVQVDENFNLLNEWCIKHIKYYHLFVGGK